MVKFISIFLSIFLIFSCSGKEVKSTTTKKKVNNSGIKGSYPENSVVAKYGKLKVIGTKLCDSKGNPVQLMGMSTHDITTSYAYITPETIKYLTTKWKIDILRIAMYYDNESYANRPEEVKSTVKNIVDLCETNGIYVIIDWHTLSDKNPLKHKEKAKAFFKEMSYLYGEKDHVIYEICNEPNGEEVKWKNAIKPYAMEVIPIIREHDDDAIILVGTATWSQDIEEPVLDPLPFDNVMYVFHFYANTHKQELRDRVLSVVDKIPLFCSEWGTTGSTGLSGFNPEESTKWLKLLAEYKISWCNWAFWAAVDDCAAINISKIKAGSLESGEIDDKMLSKSGRFVRDWLTNR
ncbi:MAG: glycoside hydrolase family 5 protein [Brevinematia bacterium]